MTSARLSVIVALTTTLLVGCGAPTTVPDGTPNQQDAADSKRKLPQFLRRAQWAGQATVTRTVKFRLYYTTGGFTYTEEQPVKIDENDMGTAVAGKIDAAFPDNRGNGYFKAVEVSAQPDNDKVDFTYVDSGGMERDITELHITSDSCYPILKCSEKGVQVVDGLFMMPIF